MRARGPRGATTFRVRRGDLVQGKEQQLCFAGAAMKRYPTSKEWWLRRRRRAYRSYPTLKVRNGGGKEIPLVQGKEQWLCFAGAAMKRYPMPKVRETQDKMVCVARGH